MVLKISFLLCVCAFLTFAQENNYRRVIQQQTVNNQLTKSLVIPINKQTIGPDDFWTELNPKVPLVSYWGVEFVTPELGWAVGQQGAIIKTTNGGEEWIDKSFSNMTDLLRLDSYNGEVVIVAGEDGIILRSADAGETWVQIQSGVTTQLWTVQMMDDTLGWICGPYGTLLKTTDAGITWEQIIITNYSDLDYWALDFFDYNVGYICCNGGQVLKTTDGGENWELQITGDSNGLYTIVSIDSLRAVTAGFIGNIYYTTNGGNSWHLSGNPLPLRIESISFANDSLGYAVGSINGVVHKTTNGGITWEFIRDNIGELFIHFINENVGYNVGLDLKVFKTTNQGTSWKKQILNNWLYDVVFINENNGWISAGPYYNDVTFPMFRTTDGGMTWEFWEHFPYDTLTSPIYTMKFFNQFVGFLGAGNNGIYKTTDGGYTWNIGNVRGLTDTLGHINRFFFYDSLIGWAINSRGGVIKTTDGGLNWFAQLNHFSTTFFQGVNFIDSLHGWAVGSRSFETTDGGNTWLQRDEFSFQFIWDVYFRDNNVGWLIGDSLSRTDDGGDTWYKVPDMPVSVGEFEWSERRVGYITGGAFYKTKNGGDNWQNIPYESGKAFTRFSTPINGLGWGVIGNGLIMKYDDRITDVKEHSVVNPSETSLYQNYPNPFNNTTVIKFILKTSGSVNITLYDILGRKIINLIDEYFDNGEHFVSWNGKNEFEQWVSSGVYIYRLTINTGKEVQIFNRKMSLIK
jgi:photosystem II stability/assembly factor-like uncharacterized protein